MSYWKDINNSSSLDFWIQYLSNSQPDTFLSRKDQNSNYQGILNDLLSEFISFRVINKLIDEEYTLSTSPTISKSTYQYLNHTSIPYNDKNGKYISPLTVTSEQFDTGLSSRTKSDTDDINKAPQWYYAGIKKSSSWPVEVIRWPDHLANSTPPMTFAVKERCYINIYTGSDEYEVNKFYTKEDNIYATSSITLTPIDGNPSNSKQTITLVGQPWVTFPYPVEPGIYEVRASLIDPLSLNSGNYDISVNWMYIHNYKTMTEDIFISDQENKICNVYVEDNKVKWKFHKIDGVYTDDAQTKYEITLLDNENNVYNPSTWAIRENLLYSFNYENGQTYVHYIGPFGTKYKYKDNKDWFLEVIIPQDTYSPEDEIQVEYRFASIPKTYFPKYCRLKVENYESETVHFVKQNGETTTNEDEAWIDLTVPVKKWKYTLENIGSYLFTIDTDDGTGDIKIAGQKAILLPYSKPLFQAETISPIFVLGISPDKEIVAGTLEGMTTLNFTTPSYIFDDESGGIYVPPDIEGPFLLHWD